jgi:hypothetical protein
MGEAAGISSGRGGSAAGGVEKHSWGGDAQLGWGKARPGVAKRGYWNAVAPIFAAAPAFFARPARLPPPADEFTRLVFVTPWGNRTESGQ